MTTNEENNRPRYSEDDQDQDVRLELIWGHGFMSPGGPEEVSRILGENKIAGLKVLDIGCGVGGADIVLVQKHGASQVMGVDVEEQLVEIARARSRQLDLDDHINYQQIEPGPLPYADASFDVVFSKDTIIHIREKKAIYAEMFRVLRPGGLLLISDWLGADTESVSPTLEEWIERSGQDFSMVSLREMGEIVQDLGFVGVELEDRQAWYLQEITQELEGIRGSRKSELVEAWGEEDVQNFAVSWEMLKESVTEGSLRPGHIRGMKPEH